jgi:hypothetical protein
MKIGLNLGVVALLLTAVPAIGSMTDAFLDQPLPARFLTSSEGLSQEAQIPKSYVERLQNLHSAIAKPIVLPEGLADFLAEKDRETNWAKGKVLFLAEGWWQSFPTKPTLRDYTQDTFAHLGLTWIFDPKQDAIIATFPWKTDDTRSGADLIQILNTTPPRTSGLVAKNDPWHVAFNALLSKPKNFARVWPLRFCADQRYLLGFPVPSNGMVAGKIQDDAGVEHFLLVTDQGEMSNPGPEGTFAYYVFDLKGRFEFGGLNTMGYRCFDDSAWIEADGRHLDVRTNNNGSPRRDSIFAIEKGRLVRTNFLQNGVQPTAEQWSDLDSGASIFSIGI